jgi:hypothetical protein
MRCERSGPSERQDGTGFEATGQTDEQKEGGDVGRPFFCAGLWCVPGCKRGPGTAEGQGLQALHRFCAMCHIFFRKLLASIHWLRPGGLTVAIAVE